MCLTQAHVWLNPETHVGSEHPLCWMTFSKMWIYVSSLNDVTLSKVFTAENRELYKFLRKIINLFNTQIDAIIVFSGQFTIPCMKKIIQAIAIVCIQMLYCQSQKQFHGVKIMLGTISWVEFNFPASLGSWIGICLFKRTERKLQKNQTGRVLSMTNVSTINKK